MRWWQTAAIRRRILMSSSQQCHLSRAKKTRAVSGERWTRLLSASQPARQCSLNRQTSDWMEEKKWEEEKKEFGGIFYIPTSFFPIFYDRLGLGNFYTAELRRFKEAAVTAAACTRTRSHCTLFRTLMLKTMIIKNSVGCRSRSSRASRATNRSLLTPLRWWPPI